MAFEGFVPPVPPSQDEMLRRRRNRDELRSVYDSYRRIKYCLSQKDARLMPDFEQAYLALITASRGCTSAQRILAELIPRYASHCPTALEAAAKVAINMYNWSFATISRGEDYDGVAFQIAKACIFGLVDICGIASSEAPTSSVIRGICSAVFLNVLTFFISSFDGKDIHEIGNKFIAVVQDSKFFSKLKQEVADEGEPMLPKLFRLRALCLLRILFCYPKNLLAACFESLKSGETETGSFASGNYLLRQVTNLIDVKYPLDKMSHEGTPQTKSMEIIADGVDTSAVGQVSCGNQVSEDASQVTKNCLMGMVLSKDPFLRDWFFVKYKKLSISLDPQILSEITLALENVFGSFLEQIKEADTEGDSDEEKSDPSKYVNRQYLLPRISNQQDDFTKRSDKDQTKRIPRTVAGDDSDSEMAEGSYPKDLETGEHEVSQHLTPPMRKPFVSNVFPSPITKTPLEHKSDTSEGAKQFIQGDMNQVSNANFGFPATRPSMEGLPDVFASFENHHYGRSNVDSSNRIGWYFDGDPAAMDVFSASKQLWLGSLGPVASESLVKFQFEKFGPVELFLFFPTKGFALVEYRNIMDAIRAREHMRGSSPWGAILQVKFLDAGLGSRGSINGVAVGWSSHVYVGNVSSHWIKDEIMHGLLRAGFRHPRTVSDLTTESALLMEFETAEEANVVMTHLRKLRKDNGYHVPINKSLTPKPCKVDVPRSHMDSARFFSASIHQDFRSNNSGSISNSMVGSPHVPPAFDSPNEDSKMRMSQLSSLLLSISSKCNTIKNHSNDNHIPKIVSDEDKVPTNTLCIGLPELDFSSSYLSDDDIMAVCNHAVGNLGSVVRLKRENIQIGFLWYVEFNSIDVAVTVMKILRSCPAMCFQISFSQPGNTQLINKSERSSHELVSPRMEPGSHRSVVQCSHPLQSNWSSSGCTEVREVGTRNIGNSDRYDTNITPDFSQAKSRSLSHANEQAWTYKKPERELQFPATGSMQYPPVAAHGMTVLPPQQIQPFMRPNYYTPNSSWNAHNAHHPLPMNHMNPAIMPNHLHVHVAPPPFLPASVTPLSQMPGNSVQHLDRMVSMPYAPALSSFPPPPHIPPPWPPSPPPLPVSQPPLVPPPPSSPPPLQSAVGPSKTGNAAQGLPAQWQGVLCKSGVHYSQVYAYREDSDACKYSNVIPEPTGWPAKLDVTKRTDFQHVKSTYTSTPPHRREVCRLLPCASEDHKGFQDFITYLKQRECAGVIKIPAEKNMWARLLFILPYSHETCSMLAIAPHPSECLIGLVVPKETNLDFV